LRGYNPEAALNSFESQGKLSRPFHPLEGTWLCHPFSLVGMAIRVRVPDTRRVGDPTGTGTEMIFYPRVAAVPDPNRDGYVMGIFSHPRVTRRVPDTLLPL
jgi:hypothetical protein